MKIGIITSNDAANCGAYLQAYASMQFLKSQGHKVFMVRWQNEKERRRDFFKDSNPISKPLKELVIHPRIYRVRGLIKEIKRHLFLYKNYRVMTKALKEFQIISPKDIKKYNLDRVVIGSDIVWDITMPIFRNPLFYGCKLPPDIPVYAYAPSAGQCEIEDFNLYPEQRDGIKKINIIGVRDEHTADTAEKITGVRPNIVCDPTLLISLEEYNIPSKPFVRDKYLLVYSYGVTEKYRKYIKKYAEERGLKTVGGFLYQDWCDINISCSPLEFCVLINQAECVFTTTFHGSIFTFLNHKPCAVLSKTKKLNELLSRTNMEEIKINDDTEYEEFKKILSGQPDYTKFECAVSIGRAESRTRYSEALK